MTAGDERIRVLWLTKGLGPGGAERLLVSFAALVDHDRFAVSAAYLLPWKHHVVPDLEGSGVSVTCLDGARLYDPRWVVRLRRLVRAQRIQVVHVHSPLVAAIARVGLRTMGPAPRVVTTEHNTWTSHNAVTRFLNRWTIDGDDHVFAVSDQVRDSMAPVCDDVEVLIHGADIEAIVARTGERAASRAALGVDDDTLLVGTVANLRANKDYPTMLAAAAVLRDRGLPIRFVSVGQGPLEDELRASVVSMGLTGVFEFLGYREDPIAVLAGCDVFCLSSLYEGLSIALIEGIALGLPAVVTDVGGMPHVITDGVNGRLVPPSDPEALADAIATMLDDDLRRSMGAAAQERSKAFGIGNAVARQQAVYEEVAGRG